MADEIDGPSTSTTPVPEPTLNTLKYTPLAGNHEFRLLRILPKLTDTPPILCELVTASVADSAGKYIAGSYVWGAPELASSIILNGISFGIRANLAYFLRACRSKYKTRVIWIDAICINQDDMAERSSQVRIMSQIYTGAASVYCWLGLDETIANALNICAQARLGDTVRPLLGKDDGKILTALRWIAGSEYFTRMWIVQEFLLGKDKHLLAGLNKVPYANFDRLLDMRAASKASFGIHLQTAHTWPAITSAKGSRMLQMRNFCADKRRPRSFEALFEAFGAMPCSVPLDRVFALLGLVTDAGAGRVTSLVDYNVTVWQLLHRILMPAVYGMAKKDLPILSPISFTNRYAANVILDAHDEHMTLPVTLDIDTCVRLPHHEESNCLDTAPQMPQPHICVQSFRLRDSTGVRDIIQYAWPTWPPRPYVLIQLSSAGSWGLCALFEPCDELCATLDSRSGTCKGHPILGFAETSPPLRPSHTSAFASALRPTIYAYSPLRQNSLLHTKFQFKILPDVMKFVKRYTRVFDVGAGKHRLEASLGMFVRLAMLAEELREAFWFEFSIEQRGG